MVRTIDVNNIDDLLDNIELIDIREPFETVPKALLNSKNIPIDELLTSPDKFLDKEKKYFIICQSGARSSIACTKLDKAGFNVVNVSGGTGGYIGTKLK